MQEVLGGENENTYLIFAVLLMVGCFFGGVGAGAKKVNLAVCLE